MIGLQDRRVDIVQDIGYVKDSCYMIGQDSIYRIVYSI